MFIQEILKPDPKWFTIVIRFENFRGNSLYRVAPRSYCIGCVQVSACTGAPAPTCNPIRMHVRVAGNQEDQINMLVEKYAEQTVEFHYEVRFILTCAIVKKRKRYHWLGNTLFFESLVLLQMKPKSHATNGVCTFSLVPLIIKHDIVFSSRDVSDDEVVTN